MPKLTLANVVRELRNFHGSPEPPPSTDPFELILWENVAYLATPERRREAFDALQQTVGTEPAAILAAGKADLERVAAHGILADKFAEKLRACARIGLERFGGNLDAAIRAPLADAKRALQAFPGIGEPGAEKILLFSGHYALLAPESNGLRVLARLGLVPEGKSYAQMYAAARDMARDSGVRGRALLAAHLLLAQHGQTLCTREQPRCDECPLSTACAWALKQDGADRSRPAPRSTPARHVRRGAKPD